MSNSINHAKKTRIFLIFTSKNNPRFFFFKNHKFKKHEAQIQEKLRNIQETLPGGDHGTGNKILVYQAISEQLFTAI